MVSCMGIGNERCCRIVADARSDRAVSLRPMIKAPDLRDLRAPLLAWGLVALVSIFLHGPVPLYSTRSLAVAWEMWDRGSWLVPLFNGAPYSHKTPLLPCLIHAGWLVTGVSDVWPPGVDGAAGRHRHRAGRRAGAAPVPGARTAAGVHRVGDVWLLVFLPVRPAGDVRNAAGGRRAWRLAGGVPARWRSVAATVAGPGAGGGVRLAGQGAGGIAAPGRAVAGGALVASGGARRWQALCRVGGACGAGRHRPVRAVAGAGADPRRSRISRSLAGHPDRRADQGQLRPRRALVVVCADAAGADGAVVVAGVVVAAGADVVARSGQPVRLDLDRRHGALLQPDQRQAALLPVAGFRRVRAAAGGGRGGTAATWRGTGRHGAGVRGGAAGVPGVCRPHPVAVPGAAGMVVGVGRRRDAAAGRGDAAPAIAADARRRRAGGHRLAACRGDAADPRPVRLHPVCAGAGRGAACRHADRLPRRIPVAIPFRRTTARAAGGGR